MLEEGRARAVRFVEGGGSERGGLEGLAGSERLSPPEADDLPVWMGVETPVARPPGPNPDSEDSRSAGSFEFLGEAADEKTCGGSP